MSPFASHDNDLIELMCFLVAFCFDNAFVLYGFYQMHLAIPCGSFRFALKGMLAIGPQEWRTTLHLRNLTWKLPESQHPSILAQGPASELEASLLGARKRKKFVPSYLLATYWTQRTLVKGSTPRRAGAEFP